MWSIIKPKRRHILALVCFLLLMQVLLYFFTINSDAYKAAQEFVSQDIRVEASIGKLQKSSFRFLSGFELIEGNGGHANFSFNVTTNKGIFVVDVRLRNVMDVWHVEAVDIHLSDGSIAKITAS